MRLVFPFLVVSTLLFSCGNGDEQKPDSAKKDSTPKVVQPKDSLRPGLIVLQPMNIARDNAFNSFYLRIGDSIFYSTYKGLMEVGDSMGNHRRQIVDLGAEFIVDQICFYRITPNTYFVSWQETSHLGVTSHFARFETGTKKPVWLMRVDAPSPGQPVIDSQYAYVSTLGMVGKLNINSGAMSWRHDSLFDAQRLIFKKFDVPKVYTNTVCFFDFTIKGKKNKRDTIWVNDKTGEIR